MLASKLCQLQHVLPHISKPSSSSLLMKYVLHARQPVSSVQRATLYRTFADDARGSFSRTSRRRTLREAAMEPAGDTGTVIK